VAHPKDDSSGDIPKSGPRAVGFGSQRNKLQQAHATLVSTVESVAAWQICRSCYLAGSSVWPTRGRLTFLLSSALH
jgi:hypothetical protein